MEILAGIRPKEWWERFWTDESADYGDPSTTLLKYISEFFVELSQQVERPTAVDIGSGNGRYAIALAKQGFLTDAVELASSGVERMQKEARAAGVTINAVQGNFVELSKREKNYHLVISSGLIEEVDPLHHQQVIAGFQNWTAKGGYAAIKYCLEIKGRGQLVADGLVPSMFQKNDWKLILVKEEQHMHPSRARFTREGEIDSAIRTGTVIAQRIG